MQRVRRPWSEFRVRPRRGKRQRSQLRIVEAVNDVVGDAGMLRLELQHAVEDLAGPLLIGVRLVLRIGSAEDGQSVEDGGFVVVGVRGRKRVH